MKNPDKVMTNRVDVLFPGRKVQWTDEHGDVWYGIYMQSDGTIYTSYGVANIAYVDSFIRAKDGALGVGPNAGKEVRVLEDALEFPPYLPEGPVVADLGMRRPVKLHFTGEVRVLPDDEGTLLYRCLFKDGKTEIWVPETKLRLPAEWDMKREKYISHGDYEDVPCSEEEYNGITIPYYY